MATHMNLEDRLAAWRELLGELHAEDAFLLRWLRYSQPEPGEHGMARELALSALDLVGGLESGWQTLSITMLRRALPINDRGVWCAWAQRFVSWLTEDGQLPPWYARTLGEQIRAHARPSEQKKDPAMAA